MSEQYIKIKTELIKSTLTDLQFRTLLYLISKAKNKKCFPSIRTLASELKKSPTSILRTIKELEELDYIKKENRKTESGKTTSNEYLLKEDLFIKNKKRVENIEVPNEKEVTDKEIEISDFNWFGE